MITIMLMIVTIIIVLIIEAIVIKYVGAPSVGILIVKAHESKNFKWLAYDILGNGDFVYRMIKKDMEERKCQ